MLTIEDVLKATGGRLVSTGGEPSISGVSIDSRTIKKGDLFICLRGENFDGHNFIKEALRKGASGVVIQEGCSFTDSLTGTEFTGPFIAAGDTLYALQELARYHREKFSIPLIGITGSNGKTTTKEMLWHILSHKYSVLKNEGNMNNHIGVPLTLFRLTPSHHMAVIEMGISAKRELTRLCQIAGPTTAVITNIGPTHLEKLGRIENVAEAKGEIINFITADGVCILNRDDTYFDVFKSMAQGRVISFGMSSYANVYTEFADIALPGKTMEMMTFRLTCPLGQVNISMRAIGLHNLYNALCAAAAAFAAGADLEEIQQGLEKFAPVKMRSVIENVGGIYILNDAYNANPASMVAAIDMLKSLKEGKQKFVVQGDMLELGENAATAHRDLGIYIAGAGIDGLISVGEFAEYVAEGATGAGMSEDRVIACSDNVQTLEKIKQWLHKGDLLLVKGSRGMKMERIIEGLKESLH